MRESDLIVKIKQALPSTTFTFKTHMTYMRSVPDCYYECAASKKALWVEYKVYPGKVTQLQRAWHNAANKRGVIPSLIVTYIPSKQKLDVEGDAHLYTIEEFVAHYLT